jgi:hypothetical protein
MYTEGYDCYGDVTTIDERQAQASGLSAAKYEWTSFPITATPVIIAYPTAPLPLTSAKLPKSTLIRRTLLFNPSVPIQHEEPNRYSQGYRYDD